MLTTIAMMQPYLFPYFGYFQLIAAADAFVLGDDLQYIKSGWVNRNNILVGGEPRLLTFPLKRDSFELAINQRQTSDNFPDEVQRLLNVIRSSYSKAPCFAQVMPLLEAMIRNPERNLARYIEHTLKELCAYLGIHTPIFRASDLQLTEPLDKQDRVIRTAKQFGAQRCINPMGGSALYDHQYFAEHGLELKFFSMDAITYRQFKGPFVANLSIIDVLMFNSVAELQALLPRYSLHTADRADRRVAMRDWQQQDRRAAASPARAELL